MPELLNSVLSSPDAVRELGPGLYTAFPQDAGAAPYDRRAVFYDAVVQWSIYHRIFWGTSTLAYSRFGRAALDAAGAGPFAEIGCGSLLFTAQMYRDPHSASVTLVDRSIQMLRRAVTRLGSGGGGPPVGPDGADGVVALHADAAAVPVHPGIFSSILSLNLLHVDCDRTAIVTEFSRLLIPGRGRLFVSSLIRSGRWSDAYLTMLHRAGEFGAPQTLDELCEKVAGRWGVVESARVEGNMSFLVVRHAGGHRAGPDDRAY